MNGILKIQFIPTPVEVFKTEWQGTKSSLIYQISDFYSG